MGRGVAEFFEHHQAGHRYHSLKDQTRLQDAAVAELLAGEVSGRLLAVGGLWEGFRRTPQLGEVTVLDLSPKMLEEYGGKDVTPIVGDVYEHDFTEGSFDSVVFALMLHHVARGPWRESEHRVQLALDRAHRWLRPGGRLFVVEYCPHRAWMPLQRAALPLTERFLRAVGQPLVVMHDRRFYERSLRATGYTGVKWRKIEPPGFNPNAWFPVFMATPWLRMPVRLYPKMHLFDATRA